jgi:hypothetical protein
MLPLGSRLPLLLLVLQRLLLAQLVSLLFSLLLFSLLVSLRPFLRLA